MEIMRWIALEVNADTASMYLNPQNQKSYGNILPIYKIIYFPCPMLGNLD